MNTRLIFILPIAVFAVLVGAFLWGLGPDRNPREVPSAMIDKPAPDFDLPAVEGLEIPGLKTIDFQGQVTLVNFFASWCIPCRIEHPLITRLGEEGIVPVWGINYKDEREDAIAWLDNLGNSYERIGFDLSGKLFHPFGDRVARNDRIGYLGHREPREPGRWAGWDPGRRLDVLLETSEEFRRLWEREA